MRVRADERGGVLPFISEGISSVLLFYAAQQGASGETVDQIHLLAFVLLLLPVFFPVLQKFYDGVIVNLILNCVRKKFNPRTAMPTLTIMCLSIPAFIAKAFGAGGSGFNAASLSRTVKSLTADAKKQKDAKKGATVKVKRIVRRKKQREGDGVTMMAAAALPVASAYDFDDDGGDDGGGGDD